MTPESTWAEGLYTIHLNSLTAVKCLLRPGVLTHPFPSTCAKPPSSNLPWLNSRQAYNMTHISSIEHGHQLCAWASLAQTGSYLQRSTGCLVTLDKASLPWEKPDSPVRRLSRANSAPLWPTGRITTAPLRVQVYFGILFSSYFHATASFGVIFDRFFRLHIFPSVCHSYQLNAGERN